MSDSARPHRRQPTRLLRPWDSPGKNTGVGCHFLLQCMKVKSESEVAQLCPTLSDLMDWSLPGSFIHGIFQARVLEWGAIALTAKFGKSLYSSPVIIFLESGSSETGWSICTILRVVLGQNFLLLKLHPLLEYVYICSEAGIPEIPFQGMHGVCVCVCVCVLWYLCSMCVWCTQLCDSLYEVVSRFRLGS